MLRVLKTGIYSMYMQMQPPAPSVTTASLILTLSKSILVYNIKKIMSNFQSAINQCHIIYRIRS